MWTGGGSTWDDDGFFREVRWCMGELSSGGGEWKIRGFLRGVGGWYIGKGVLVFEGSAPMTWLGLDGGLRSRCGVYTGWGGNGREVLGREGEDE